MGLDTNVSKMFGTLSAGVEVYHMFMDRITNAFVARVVFISVLKAKS
jgi:hypothetical protein